MFCAKGRGRRRRGFTLIEIVITMVVISLMAVMAMPRGFFSFESPMRALQRTVMELSDVALDGVSVRMRLDLVDRAETGSIVVEALSKVPDRYDSTRYTLEWTPLTIRYPLEGDRWLLDPPIIYFFRDGTCTPARILRADRDSRISEGESALLTVTGYLFEETDGKS
ncbi:MAG: prepilin-type N-terminal cleavage/methylation domain-containing protein [Synergistaceae bacterium]|jgi:prepilin-type N-terminal cleavage/methylation domain-containing protein|nr:prepilin-type N-terminal cleavage/methylation domain-containing protein [Synergistaceae bacterium]